LGLLISVYQISKTGTRDTSGAKVPTQVMDDQGSNPGGGKGAFVFSVQECSGEQPDLI